MTVKGGRRRDDVKVKEQILSIFNGGLSEFTQEQKDEIRSLKSYSEKINWLGISVEDADKMREADKEWDKRLRTSRMYRNSILYDTLFVAAEREREEVLSRKTSALRMPTKVTLWLAERLIKELAEKVEVTETENWQQYAMRMDKKLRQARNDKKTYEDKEASRTDKGT